MGLDVKVYNGITQVSDQSDIYDFVARNYTEFKDRAKSLDMDGKYTAEKSTHMISYPYSTHNDFRRELAELIGKPRDFWQEPNLDKDIPFYELFEFADNEGTIDSESALNLYNDFVEHHEAAATSVMSAFWFDIYQKWTQVFEIAKNNGVVVFT